MNDNLVLTIQKALEDYRFRDGTHPIGCAEYIAKAILAAGWKKSHDEPHTCGFCRDTICGVSYYRKYGDTFTFFEQGMNFQNLDLSDYDTYQEFCMNLVYLLGQARIKFEQQSSERLKAQEATDLAEARAALNKRGGLRNV